MKMLRKNRYSEFSHRDTYFNKFAYSTQNIPSSSPPSRGKEIRIEYAKGKYFRSLEGHTDAVLCITVSKSTLLGNLVISGGLDKTIRMWDIDNNSCTNVLRGHKMSVTCLYPAECSSDDVQLLSGSSDCSIILWSLKDGIVLKTLEGHTSIVTSLVFYKYFDIPVCFSSSNDTDIRYWELAGDDADKNKYVIGSHNGKVSCLAIANVFQRSLLVSAGYDQIVKVWDIQERALLSELVGHYCNITAVAVSGECSLPFIVSGASDGGIIVWDMNRLGNILYILKEPMKDEIGFNEVSEISSIAVSNGAFPIILTSSWGSDFHVWDHRTGGLLRIYRGHTNSVTAVATTVCEVGPLIVSSSIDSSITLWSPEEDLAFGVEGIKSIDYISLEDSLVLVGRYISYWNLVMEGNTQSTNTYLQQGRATIVNEKASLIFYCIIRMGHVNPNFVRVHVNALKHLMNSGMKYLDLLQYDPLVDSTPLQFLFENRLCLHLAHEWMQTETNLKRVMFSLEDSTQSGMTLNSILSAVLTSDRQGGGWNVLLSHVNFKRIFLNLVINSPRSHGKIALLLQNHGLGVEPDPYPSPLPVSEKAAYTVVRWHDVKHGSGIYCYRIRVNSLFSTEFLLSPEFFSILAHSEFIEELASVPLIEYLVQYKWEHWGSHTTFRLGLFNVVYLITTTVSVISICSGDFVSFTSNPIVVVSIAFSLLCNSLQMALAMWQFGTTNKITYITNLWNLTDILMIVLCHLSIILGTALGPMFGIKVLSTILTLVLWGRLVYFGRGAKSLSMLIYTMKRIIWEVRYFMLILFLFVAAFAISFKVLGVFQSLFISFLLCVNMMLGDVGFQNVRGQVFAEILYLGFIIMVAIILLNSLIAFMQTSLDNSVIKKNVAAVVSRIKMIHELEVKILPIERLLEFFLGNKHNGHHKQNPGDLVILVPEIVGKPNLTPWEPTADLLRRLDTITSNTSQNINELNEKMRVVATDSQSNREALERRMAKLEQRLDQLISLVSNSRSSNTTLPTPQQGKASSSEHISYTYFGDDEDDTHADDM